MSNPESFVGIDVAKGWLDVAWLTGETLRIDHAEKAIAGLVERLRSQPPALVVMEATGGLETGGGQRLGRRRPGGAQWSTRGRFTTTPRPAAAWPRPTASMRLSWLPSLLPSALRFASCPTSTRGRWAICWRGGASSSRCAFRRSCGCSVLPNVQRASLREHIVWLDERIGRLDIDLTHALRSSPAWRDKDDLLKPIPGVAR